MTPSNSQDLNPIDQVATKKSNIILSLFQALWTNIRQKNYLWLGLRVFLPLVILSVIGFTLVNYNLGITPDAAYAKLSRENIPVTNYSGFKYAAENNLNVVNLLIKSGLKQDYIIAGAVAKSHKSILNNVLNSKSNLTTELSELDRYWSPTTMDNYAGEPECKTALGLSVKVGNIDIIKQLLSNPTYISNKNDCSVITAVKIGNTEIINLLNKEGMKLAKTDLITLITNGYEGVIPFIDANTYDETMLSAIENMNHSQIEKLGEPKHTQVEQAITDAVLKSIPTDSKNQLLAKALIEDKLVLAAGLIRNGAKPDVSFTPKGSDKPTTVIEYTIAKKNDKLASALIAGGYKFQEVINVTDVNNLTIKENTLNHFINSGMVQSSIAMVEKGHNINSTFRVSSTSTQELPIVFAAANVRAAFPVLSAMIKRDNAVKTLSPELRQKLVASVFNNLGYSEDKIEDLAVLKDLVTQDVDINSTLNQVSYGLDNSNYAQLSAPIWGTVYLSKVNNYSVLNAKTTAYLGEYYKIISPYIKKYDFTRDGFTSIGMAVVSENIEMIKLLLDNKVSANSVVSTGNNKPVFQQALESKNDDVVKVMLKSDIKLNEVIKAGNSETTFLINAVKNTNSAVEKVKLLVEAGANVNLCVSYNELEQVCPLGSAISNNSKSEVVYYLESKGAKCNYVGNGLCKK
jgi:Ankyrin repeats (3 copies)